MKYLMIPLVTALLASQPVFAECTTDQISAKAEQLAERVNQLTESDPERAAKINEEIKQQNLKRSADEMGTECDAYDQRLKDIENAEKKAGIAPAETR